MANDNSDRFPMDDLYAQRDYADTERWWKTHLLAYEPSAPAKASETQGEPHRINLTITPEEDPRNLVLEPVTPGAPAPAPPVPAEVRSKLAEDTKDNFFRDAFNKVLGTLTGGVITLDKIDTHLQQQVQGVEDTDLSKELRGLGALKLLDPVGNTAIEMVREQATKDGLPPEVVDKMASVTGMVIGAATPGIAGKGKVAKAVTSAYYQSLLSNPATHAANVGANALASAWAIPERFLSALASAGEYAVTLGAHERTVFFGESAAMAYGMANEVLDAILTAGRSMAKGKFGPTKLDYEKTLEGLKVGDESVIDGVKYRVTRLHDPVDVGERLAMESGDNTVGNGLGFWAKVWHGASEMSPTNLLVKEDQFFKSINRSGELAALGYRDAATGTGDLFGTMKRMIANPPGEIENRARQFALTYTFNHELADLGAIGQLGRIGQSVADVPMGRLVVPFMRTQTNMTHFVFDRAPILNMINSSARADIAAGGTARSLVLGKIAGGSLLAGTVAWAAGAGLVTGGGPVDPVLLQNLKDTGWQPYSLHIGGKYYSYDRLQPLGSMLGIVADASEIMGELPDHKITPLVHAIGLSLSRNLVSKTYLENAGTFLEAMVGDQKALNALGRSLLRTAVPGVVRAAKRETDPTSRETNPGADMPEEGSWNEVRNIVNQLKAETPGFSSTLPPRRNLWGEPIQIPAGWMVDWLSPVFTSTDKKDPASDEIARLRLPIGRWPRTILGAKSSDSAAFGKEPTPLDTGIELTDAEYDEFSRLAGNELKVKGMGLHEAMNQMVTSDKRYLDASDTARGVLITSLKNAYERGAEAQMIKLHPEILEAYKQQLRQKGEALRPTIKLPQLAPPPQNQPQIMPTIGR